MNTILKALMVIGVAALCILGVCTFARADCENGEWAPISAQLAERGTVEKLSGETIKRLVDKLGPPPGVDGDFDLYLAKQPPFAAVFVVQGECLMNRIGPAPVEDIERFLGVVSAKVQGERVD